MINLIYSWEELEEEGIQIAVDEGECELGITCHQEHNDRNAAIGLSSEGEFFAVAVMEGQGDDAQPVLACEDCESWLRDLYTRELSNAQG